MIGQTISHYRILEKLGEGGMGIVYKAHDAKLDRIVALKFLPKGLETHEQERTRFLQEAKAASALNHPHICAIHALGEHEGREFIDMEFVDGVTLREKVRPGQVPANEAISYAIQIGDALQEAHTHGIVHRDIKPENIMLNTKNQIKVMDFGLAKLKGSLKLTKTSSTVGTLAYMAPEQIQGGDVDARSDIFAFGVVLFEMLTDQLPFRGEHEAAMMYSILNEEPDPVVKYRPSASPDLDRIVKRALEKDPEDRYQSAADMVSELRRVLKHSTKVTRTSVPLTRVPGREALPQLQEAIPESRSRGARTTVVSAIVLVVMAILGVLYFAVIRTRTVELNPDMKFQTLQISFSQVSYSGLSADGNWVAFPAADASGKWDVYYMNVAVGEPRRVTFDSSADPWNNASAIISPDGGLIAYCRSNARTGWYDAYVVPSIGGRSKKIADYAVGAQWRRDGERIGYIVTRPRPLAIWSVKPDGTDRRREVLDTLTSGGRIAFDWSPRGSEIVFLRSFPGGYQEAIRLDLETGKETQLTFDKQNIDEVCWTPNDQIIYSSNKSGNTNLWMIPASGGQSIQITKGSGPDIGMSISADGKRLLYIQRQQAGYLWRAAVDGHTSRQLTTDERNIVRPSLSPDGKQIAFSMSDNDPLKASSHIYICDRDGSNRRQLTTGDEITQWPAWSPNGRWIAYGGRTTGENVDSSKIYIVDPTEPGIPRLLGRGVFIRWIDTTSLTAYFPSRNKGSTITLDGKSTTIAYKDSVTLWPILDGKNVLLIDSHIGKNGWYVVAAKNNQVIEGASPKKLIPILVPPNISPDKKFFYYVAESEILRRISLPEGKEEHIEGTFPGLSWMFALSSDGREIVYNNTRVNTKLVLIENLFR